MWCRCRVVVPAPAVLPLRGALPFREPTPPKPSTTTRRGLDFLGSSLFSSFLSFHSSSLASLFFSSIRLLLTLSSFVSIPPCFFLLPLSSLFHPLSPSLLSFHPPTLPPLPSIDSRPLATLSSAILCLQLLCFQSEPPESRHQKRIRLCRPSTKHKHYHLLQKPYVLRGDNRREESLWGAPRSGEL